MEYTLLPDAVGERAVRTCREVAGDRLRSVTYFNHDDYEQLYLRDDLERGADLSSFVGVEWRESGITEDAYRGTELGEHRYTIRAFENGYLLRVSAERDGLFVTLDGLSMEGFEESAEALIDLLESLSGHDR